MRFRKLLTVLVLVTFAFGFPVDVVQGSAAVEIPIEVTLAIGSLLLAVFTAGFVYVFEKTGLDLQQYAIPVAGTISTFLVGKLQGWINVLDPSYDPTVTLIFNLLIVLLGAAGVLRLTSRQPSTLLPSS